MEFRWIDTKNRFRPFLSPTDLLEESKDEYCARMKDLLPRFPPQVLKQWFYRHWTLIDTYAWLGFERLSFEKHKWSSIEVMRSGIQDNESIQNDYHNFEEGVSNLNIDRIADFFVLNGTWPVPPIFLSNLAGEITYPNGLRLTAPYHLLEGSHRAGLFWSFFERRKLVDEHLVWVATLDDT
jgi:hypothetical protein